jgi:hypothetical protein
MKREENNAVTDNVDLYQMINKVYTMRNPISRLLYIGKIKENEKLSRQALNDSIVIEISRLMQEVKANTDELQSEDFNSYLVIFLGSNLGNFCIVLLEVSN